MLFLRKFTPLSFAKFSTRITVTKRTIWVVTIKSADQQTAEPEEVLRIGIRARRLLEVRGRGGRHAHPLVTNLTTL